MRLSHAHYNMMRRCYNPDDKDFRNYGGRGIMVDESFHRFDDYHQWFRQTFTLNDIPTGLTLDRANNNGNYSPDNMRLATMKEQNNNRRSNKQIEYNGETHTISQWANIVGIDRKTLEKRFGKFKWSPDKALTTPVNAKWKYYEYNGELHTLNDWSRISGVPRFTIESRLKRGASLERAIKKERFYKL
jgi:hypothetical protein